MSHGGSRDDEKPLNWWQILLMWSAIAFGVLFFGGAALRALSGLNRPPPDLGFGTFWCPLAIFSLGGGAAIGLIILTWWFVVTRGSFSWTLGFAVLGLVLFALFVWPSPYRYDKDQRRDATCRVLRIQRWTGDAMCILSANPPPPARPGSA